MSTYARTRGRKPRITYEEIVCQALELIDERGLEALSMRRLGKQLGVDPMSIYHHIPGKSELLDAVIDSVMAQVDLTVDDPSAPWQERVRRLATAYRDALAAHPNLIPAIAAGRARMFGGLAPAETLLSIFDAAGLPRARWLIAMNAFSAWVLGATTMELTTGVGASRVIVDWAASVSHDDYPHVATAVATHHPAKPDAYFRYGVMTLIAGLAAIASGDEPNGNGR